MSLRARVVSGLFWIGGTRLIGQILTWGITIVVIRLLTPGTTVSSQWRRFSWASCPWSRKPASGLR